jgi:hypothetical protein
VHLAHSDQKLIKEVRLMSRYRESNEEIPQTYSYTVKVTPPGTSTTIEQDLPPNRRVREMTDTKTPDYFGRVARGEILPVNGMLKRIESHEYKPSSQYSVYRKSGIERTTSGETNMFVYTGFPPLPPEDQAALERARTAAITSSFGKVDSSSMLILATLKELKDTREMLVSTVHKVAQLADALNHYNRTIKRLWRKKRHLGEFYMAAEEAWMSVRMGWRPFYGEVTGLIDACTKVRKFYDRQTFRAVRSKSAFAASTGTKYAAPFGLIPYASSTTVTTVYRAGVLCERRYNGFPDTFGLTKIPQTLWEITPCSWAVDYFFNVGDVISAYTPDTLWKPVASWVTERTRSKQQIIGGAKFIDAPFYLAGSHDGGGRTSTIETVSRSVSSRDDVGLTFDPKLNWAKYIDLAALTRQRMKTFYSAAVRNRRRYRIKPGR